MTGFVAASTFERIAPGEHRGVTGAGRTQVVTRTIFAPRKRAITERSAAGDLASD